MTFITLCDRLYVYNIDSARPCLHSRQAQSVITEGRSDKIEAIYEAYHTTNPQVEYRSFAIGLFAHVYYSYIRMKTPREDASKHYKKWYRKLKLDRLI